MVEFIHGMQIYPVAWNHSILGADRNSQLHLRPSAEAGFDQGLLYLNTSGKSRFQNEPPRGAGHLTTGDLC